MPHITLTSRATSKPSLEFYPDGGGEVRRVVIESFPYRIGRADSANLKIESAQVSREHVEIFERSGVWLARDLGSTNGTLINGKTITETLLSDGDILQIADTELTFVASPASQFQRMVTQPIQAAKRSHAPHALSAEIAAARILTEATLWQAIAVPMFTVSSLRGGISEAMLTRVASDSESRQLFGMADSVGERYRELHRMRGVELAVDYDRAKRLFVAVDKVELAVGHRLFASLDQIRERLPSDWDFGITISVPSDIDVLTIGEVYREARDLGLLIAFDEFQGNGGQVMHLESCLPDYLILSAAMTKDLTSTRQPLRRLESLYTACEELAVRPVLARTDCAHTLAICQEIGYDLVLRSAAANRPAKKPAKAATV